MTTSRPLCIWPNRVPDEQMQLIRQAKANLDLPYKVIPSPAVPGGHERVLAMGELPPFLCEGALVKDPTNAQSVENALRWLLTAPDGDMRGFGYTAYLASIFGADVKEVTQGWEPLDSSTDSEPKTVRFVTSG